MYIKYLPVLYQAVDTRRTPYTNNIVHTLLSSTYSFPGEFNYSVLFTSSLISHFLAASNNSTDT